MHLRPSTARNVTRHTVTVEPDHPEPELLDQMVVELRDHGKRAIEFLVTARGQIDGGLDHLPRSPENVAYCLREVLTSITDSQDRGEPREWRAVLDRIARAKSRYLRENEAEPAAPAGDEALVDLMSALSDLEGLPRAQDLRQKQLIAAIVDRTGSVPYAMGPGIVRAFQQVVDDANRALHSEIEPVAAINLYNRTTSVLRRLFLPAHQRQEQLQALAAVVEPGDDDLERLRQLVVSPQHLVAFLRSLPSAAWLRVLAGTELVDPPLDRSAWPGFAAVDALAPIDAAGVVEWLGQLYERCRRSPAQAWFILRAAQDAGAIAHDLFENILADHVSSSAIRGLEGYSG